ncbi:hypothetical protein ACFFLS_07665 [Flavobacterium procerum]|uniref:Lipoprotein n=1 Tax=Flavobacterium procerum TaxID=1455569 RepID=A0ABV6BN90_9FLAO
MSEGSSSGKFLLSFGLAAFAIIRLLYTCSADSYAPRQNNIRDVEFKQGDLIWNKTDLKVGQKSISKDIMYKSYLGLDSLNAMERDDYGLLKLEKDTLLLIDIKTQIKIPKEYYFQNAHDDSLHYAFKAPDNLNFFIHDFEAKGDLEENFKAVKHISKLQKYKLENTIDNTKVVSYKIVKNNKRFNGYALCFKNVDADLHTFFEFESDVLTKEKLQDRALAFLTQNMKEKK